MFFNGFNGGPSWGGQQFGGPGGFGGGLGPGGFGGFSGGGFGGPGAGKGPWFLKRAAFGTAAVLLDGPATAAQVIERVSAASDGALNPPEDIVELAIALLAGRGLVAVDDGVASLTDLGKQLLAFRCVTSETAQLFFKKAGKFADVFKIRKELFEVAGLARTIAFTGTDEQKAKLAETRGRVLATLTEAKKELHRVLADG
ncbi:MAG: hypothetical protein U0R77_04990 [Mycolicibacterium insubricum]|nr:hypothetical protein [Mycobacterium sp.]